MKTLIIFLSFLFLCASCTKEPLINHDKYEQLDNTYPYTWSKADRTYWHVEYNGSTSNRNVTIVFSKGTVFIIDPNPINSWKSVSYFGMWEDEHNFTSDHYPITVTPTSVLVGWEDSWHIRYTK